MSSAGVFEKNTLDEVKKDSLTYSKLIAYTNGIKGIFAEQGGQFNSNVKYTIKLTAHYIMKYNEIHEINST